MKRFLKFFALLTVLAVMFAALAVTAYADDPAPVDMSLIFSPETQLTVFVDGEWSAALSGTYGYGESVSLAAPAVEGKSFSHWEADGSVISYENPLKLTVNANTTLFAVYAESAPTAKPVAGFTSITRSTDGEQIVFQAKASGEIAGFVYSTTATDNDLKIDGEGVTNVAAVNLDDNIQKIPESALDDNNCYMYKFKPDSADTVYHVRAYVTDGGAPAYSDVKDVKLSELPDGVSMIANLEGFNPESKLDEKLANLTNGMHTVTFEPNGGVGTTITQGFLGNSVTLRANTFTNEGYTFNGWNTAADGSGTAYADGQSVTIIADTTLYAQWKSNTSGDNSSGYVGGGTTTYTAEVKDAEHGIVTVDPKTAAEGAKVTITVKPDEGYEVDAVTVKDADGKDVPATKNADGTYSYTQPKGKVTVTATFKEKAKENADGLTAEALLKMFSDLDPKGWYLDDVRYCVENGMMNGVGDGKFDPNGTTTRAMIVTILYRLEGEPVIRSGMPFSDAKESDWYAKAVSWAESQGIVTGYGNGKFGPNDPITREQLAAILYRYAQYKGQGFQGLWSFKLDFPDAGDVSDWATEAMSWMVMNGVINGMDGKLNPQGNATRVQVAAMVHRFCELIK